MQVACRDGGYSRRILMPNPRGGGAPPPEMPRGGDATPAPPVHATAYICIYIKLAAENNAVG